LATALARGAKKIQAQQKNAAKKAKENKSKSSAAPKKGNPWMRLFPFYYHESIPGLTARANCWRSQQVQEVHGTVAG